MALQSSHELFYWALTSLGAIALGICIVVVAYVGMKRRKNKTNDSL